MVERIAAALLRYEVLDAEDVARLASMCRDW
jgi:hypothetical protein